MEIIQVPFLNIITDITSKFNKIPNKDFISNGLYPIIDQGANIIAGYTNDQSNITDIGYPVIVFGDHTRLLKFINFPFAIGADGVKVLSVDSDQVYPLYVYYFLKFLKIPNAGYSRHYKFLKEKKIAFPKFIDDQKRIAKVLLQCEDLIKKRNESIDLLDELLRSTFLEMFGDPVRNEKGWKIVPLSKFGTIDRGVSKHRPRNAPELLNGIYPLIQTGDVSNAGTYITQYKQTYSDLGLQQSKLWPAGTLCITIAANIAKTGILTFDACFPDSIVGLIVDPIEATNLYVHHLFSFFQRILEKNAPSAAQKNINLEILRTFRVPQPPIVLLSEFDIIVNKVEGIKKHYIASFKELENLYGSISQRAFNGELDLNNVDISDMEDSKKKDGPEETIELSMEEKRVIQEQKATLEGIVDKELEDSTYLSDICLLYIQKSKDLRTKVYELKKNNELDVESIKEALIEINNIGENLNYELKEFTPWQIDQHKSVERYLKLLPDNILNEYPNVNLFSRNQFDYRSMSLDEYYGIPDDIIAEYGSIESHEINFEFFFKKYFSNQTFTISEVEALYNRVVYDRGDWFNYEDFKEIVFKGLEGDDAFFEQTFEEVVLLDRETEKKKITKKMMLKVIS